MSDEEQEKEVHYGSATASAKVHVSAKGRGHQPNPKTGVVHEAGVFTPSTPREELELASFLKLSKLEKRVEKAEKEARSWRTRGWLVASAALGTLLATPLVLAIQIALKALGVDF